MKELIQALIEQGIITAIDIQRMTTLELLLAIVERVNELHGLTKEGLEAVQRLLDKGVQEEVIDQLDEWMQDGTFDTLINQTALKEVNKRIDETNAQLSEVGAFVKNKNFVVTLEDFGGSTELEDNKQAWDSAMEFLSNNGGGKLLIKNGLYNFSTPIKIKSNCHVEGNGKNTILRVKDNNGSFYNFVGMDRQTNTSLKNIKIDLNRRNNGGVIETVDGAFNPQIAIYFVNSHYATVENVHIDACGVWSITAEAGDNEPFNSNITIKGCHIDWYPQTTEKDAISTNMLYDNTMIYLDAENYVLEDNTITCLKDQFGMTGIEMHQNKGKSINNRISNFRNGFLLVPMISDFNDLPCDFVVIGNTIYAHSVGISLWEVKTKVVDNVMISNNIITLNSTGHEASYGIDINPSVGTTNKGVKNIGIYNNNIKFEADLTKHNSSDYLLNFCGIWMRSNYHCENISIKGNTIENSGGNGIFVGSGRDGYKIENVTISENTIINPCSNTNISLNGYTKRAHIYIGSRVEGSIVGKNYLIGTTIVDIPVINASKETTVLDTQMLNLATHSNDYVVNSFSPQFRFDSGSATFDAIGTYYTVGRLCYINVTCTISNPSSTGYSLNFKLPFSAKAGKETLNVVSKGINTDVIFAETMLNSDVCYIRMGAGTTNFNAIGPANITDGSVIIIKGYYLF